MDSRFGSLEGVLRTKVGYAGGATRNPTYEKIGDHTEVVEVIFDPERISYEQLLEIFWSSHDPTRGIWSRQYRNVIFYIGEGQKEVSLFSRKTIQKQFVVPVKSDFEPLETFYPAEDYHQKYMLRRYSGLFAELVRQFGSEKAALESTLAARINGFLGGYGSRKDLEKNLRRSGMSNKGRKGLEDALDGRLR